MDERGTTTQHHPAMKSLASSLRARCGVKAGDGVVVAVSGGPDSVALLRMLAALAPRRRWGLKLTVAHVQHHLRGEQAEEDAGYVEALAERVGLPYERADLNLSVATGNRSAEARRLRYEALEAIAKRQSAAFIATGHHADDQLETVVMRLMRGASVAGLRGVAWRRRVLPGSDIRLIRPLLGVTRDDLRDVLDQFGQGWRDDPTNRDTTTLRARLRHDVLPALLATHPALTKRAGRLADQMREVDRLIETQADELLDGVEGSAVKRTLLRQRNPIIIARVVQRLIQRAGETGMVGGAALERVVWAIQDREGGERRFGLRGVEIVVTRDAVRCE